MEIDVKEKFCDVPIGETFYYDPSGTMWTRLNEPPLFDKYGDLYNAVALDDGIPSHFENDDIVTIIPTKLVNANA